MLLFVAIQLIIPLHT